ncbi:MAG: tandem-95 repeat protein [Archangiaceae bacterium]|nr:tandem-95 repeat protein [Archangiaceae bacterium]
MKGNDGFVDSSPPTRINLTVTPVNDAPVALMQEVNGSEDLPVTIVLAGRDVDGDGLTFRVATAPTHGSLSGNAPNLTFTPQANDSADDTFTFVVNDGTVDSAPATVTVHLQPVNDAPVAQALTFTTSRDVPVEVTLSASDLDGDGLTFEVAAAPSNGTLSGTAPDLTYTPNSGFTGSDSFTYRASDGSLASTPAMVTLTVSGDNQSVPKETYARVNGWTCGCGQTGFAPGLLGLSWLLLRKRRRGGRVAQVALAVVLVAATAWAKPAPKKKGKAAAPAAAVEAPAPAPATVVEPEPTAPAPAAPVVVTAPQPQGPPSLAALEVAVTVPSEKLDGSAFTEMLVSAIAQSGLFKVISASEVATLLGVERQRQLMGCGEDSCLAEISDALGAQYLLQGAVGKVGDNYLVTVRLLDSRRSVVVGRSALQTTDVGLLLSLVWRATNETVDAAANGLSGPERERWLARPREEPAAAVPPAKVKFGIAVTAVGGYQPRADPGYRASFGGEVDLTLRVARLDLGAGVVVSPSPGGRVSVTIALLAARNRVALGARGVYFPGARLGGGGVVATYEFLLSSIFGVRALVAAEAYAGAPSVVLALLGGIGVEAHF